MLVMGLANRRKLLFSPAIRSGEERIIPCPVPGQIWARRVASAAVSSCEVPVEPGERRVFAESLLDVDLAHLRALPRPVGFADT